MQQKNKNRELSVVVDACVNLCQIIQYVMTRRLSGMCGEVFLIESLEPRTYSKTVSSVVFHSTSEYASG
jgi:hypothetical protein